MSEKVLFELRVTPDGVRVFESPEWRAYHARRGGRFPFGGWRTRRGAMRPDRRASLRRQRDALQNVYNDLYGG
jgi:hypothetical protein